MYECFAELNHRFLHTDCFKLVSKNSIAIFIQNNFVFNNFLNTEKKYSIQQ